MRDVRWHQVTPKDQLTVILMSLEMHISNYQEGVIEIARFMEYYDDLIQQISQLKPFLEKGMW